MKKLTYILPIIFAALVASCTDDTSYLNPEQPSGPEVPYWDDLPEEFKNGYTVTFGMSLDPMGGEEFGLTTRAATTATEEYLRQIENFVDLEKLRVLFFTCLDNDDNTGRYDVFLFESKSRWVSILSDAESTSASWMVTSPIFTYGNNEEYDWDKIQDILKERPFKIAILANRPDRIRFSDFDNNQKEFGDGDLFKDGQEFNYPNKGPEWGLAESTKAIADYENAKKQGFTNLKSKKMKVTGEMINNLHHCQWDPVYALKNSNSKAGSNYCYDFIIKNPGNHTTNVYDKSYNWMGAVSYWTHWQKKSESEGYYHDASSKMTKLNWYTWPDRNQGIPMYGVQKFNPLTTWLKGTPFNISERQVGEDGQFVRKNIHLLRSLARIDLYIPKSIGKLIVDPTTSTVNGGAKVGNNTTNGSNNFSFATVLQYSNVFGRCEPMDVATPTEQIWASEHHDTGNVNNRCEFWNIYDYGPIITSGLTASETTFRNRVAWFYGTWNEWGWFEDKGITLSQSQLTGSGGINGVTMPSPRIFNPCIQRNQYAYLNDVMVDDDIPGEKGEYHFIIYTGERNINDPSDFKDFDSKKGEFPFFTIYIQLPNKNYISQYVLPLLRHSSDHENNFWKTYFNGESGTPDAALKAVHSQITKNSSGYHDYCWPIVRNHVYTFRVLGINGNIDKDGLSALVISSEERSTPYIDFY